MTLRFLLCLAVLILPLSACTEPDRPTIGLYLAVQRGVRQHHWTFGNMPPVPGLNDREVAFIIAYVRELQRANGIN